MVNNNEKLIKDQLELASKLIFQTADESFIGRNALTAIETGDIMIHKSGSPLTQIANNSHDITALQNSQSNWKNQGMDISGTPEAMRGTTMPSGTPAVLVQQLAAEAASLFSLMVQNKGLAIEEMMRRFILPYLAKQMNNNDEIASTLANEDIQKIDAMYIPNEAIRRHNAMNKAAILQGGTPSPYDPRIAQKAVQDQLAQHGNQRFFAPGDVSWKELFKDFKARCEVEVTSEDHDKRSLLTSLSTVFTSLVQMGDVVNARLVLGKIMEETGVLSPTELSQIQSAPMPQPNSTPSAPVAGAAGGGSGTGALVPQPA
jgi:hypothetical protein